MNLPDINNMYPQSEPEQLDECIYCGTEIYVTDRYVKHCEDVFCSEECLGKRLVKIGLAEWMNE